MAPPAPASEAAFEMTLTATSAAAPLSELDCNGSAHKLAMRRCASFLDAEDTCLALPSKACFLIPEDSYLPGQENCAVRGTAAVIPPPGPRSMSPCPALVAATEPPGEARQHQSPDTAGARPLLRSPFMLSDLGVLGGEDEFVAASVCFEKAVQELEMVERPVVLNLPLANAPALPTAKHPHCCQLAALGGCSGAGACCAAAALQQPVQHVGFPPRYASSLVPSPAASAGQQPPGSDGELPAQPQGQPQRISVGGGRGECDGDAVTSALRAAGLQGGGDGVEAAVAGAVSGQVVSTDWWQQRSVSGGMTGSDGGAAAVASAVPVPVGQHEWEPESVPVSPAATAAAAPAGPLATGPLRAFHHKTGGPCDHCGATESPQWRRGPPAKPMLCNACGTRYRRTNQLNPASANAAAARAAAAAAAAAAGVAPVLPPPSKGRGAKRDGSAVGGSSKRGRAASYY